MSRYYVEKKSGRVYCGNGFFDTLDECVKFAKDGFCDKAIIQDNESGTKLVIKITAFEIADLVEG